MTETTRVSEWLAEAHRQLSGRAEQPALEVQVLLAHVVGQTRAWVIAHPEFAISIQQEQTLNTLLEKRRQGQPLPYLLGHWEFYGLDFLINPAVLIPRPETELLVEEAIHWIRGRKEPGRGIDTGTGSGCIAISLSKSVSGLDLIATDISRPALDTCVLNAVRHGVRDRIALVQADLLESLRGPFDLLCANLPYIPTAELAALDVTRHEPSLALNGGADGLRLVEPLLVQAASRMAAESLLLLEIEAGERDQALKIACQTFPRAAVQVLPDLAGMPRLLRIENGGKKH